MGNVLATGGFAAQARMAQFLAGFPQEVTISTCNRQCASGLQALVHVAGAIKAGAYDIGIAAGVESMSTADMMSSVGELNDKVFDVPKAAACLNTMGQTSENVAAKFKISRDKQDALAFESHRKALKVRTAEALKLLRRSVNSVVESLTAMLLHVFCYNRFRTPALSSGRVVPPFFFWLLVRCVALRRRSRTASSRTRSCR